ncbi:hypothetical protein K438DRAFT_1755469 [Mycena galopus ATCC 62051]|nr:hypothetical protein K438DRAFT_1755469 [Mycena galopus ATCC 62051]
MLCATVTVWSCEQSQPLKGKKLSVPRLRRPNSGMGLGCPRRPCGAGAWAWGRGGTGQREPAGARGGHGGECEGWEDGCERESGLVVVDRGLSSSWHVPEYGRGWESVSRVQAGQSCGTSLWALGVERVNEECRVAGKVRTPETMVSLYASGSGGTAQVLGVESLFCCWAAGSSGNELGLTFVVVATALVLKEARRRTVLRVAFVAAQSDEHDEFDNIRAQRPVCVSTFPNVLGDTIAITTPPRTERPCTNRANVWSKTLDMLSIQDLDAEWPACVQYV